MNEEFKLPEVTKDKKSKLNSKFKLPSKFNKTHLIAFIGAFLIIGGLIIGFSSASSQLYKIEAEDGNLTGKAVVAQNANASNGEVLQFGTKSSDDTTDDPTPPAPPPPPANVSSGIWLKKDEIMALPMSGSGWDNVKSAATGSLGSVNLGDNNNTHDTKVLALAYYAVRTNDSSLIKKTAQEIDTVRNSSRERALPFCRNIASYVIAADVINLSQVNPTIDKNFRDFIRYWVFEDTSLQGHSGNGIKGTASNAPNNWGTMCRGSYAATAVYLGDNNELNNVTDWHKGWLGDTDTYDGYVYKSTNWHANPNDKVGVNRKGATIQGRNVDGVMPEDQRRTGEFTWPAPKGSYPWEALQGAIVADVILQRAGKITNNFQDSAMVRAYNWLYFVNNNPASSDDTWQPWLANKIYGTNYPTSSPSNQGKIMGWTDWTHQR